MTRYQYLPQHLEARITSEISTRTALKEKTNTKTRGKAKEPKESDLNMLSEHQEQCLVVEYCDLNKIPIFAIPNGSNKSKIQSHLFKCEGLRAGVPDLCIPVKRGNFGSLYIEMKRKKKATVSIKQKAWLVQLNILGHKAVVCFGADEAIKTIEDYLGLLR